MANFMNNFQWFGNPSLTLYKQYLQKWFESYAKLFIIMWGFDIFGFLCWWWIMEMQNLTMCHFTERWLMILDKLLSHLWGKILKLINFFCLRKSLFNNEFVPQSLSYCKEKIFHFKYWKYCIKEISPKSSLMSS